jgi:hypothetical protein
MRNWKRLYEEEHAKNQELRLLLEECGDLIKRQTHHIKQLAPQVTTMPGIQLNCVDERTEAKMDELREMARWN